MYSRRVRSRKGISRAARVEGESGKLVRRTRVRRPATRSATTARGELDRRGRTSEALALQHLGAQPPKVAQPELLNPHAPRYDPPRQRSAHSLVLRVHSSQLKVPGPIHARHAAREPLLRRLSLVDAYGAPENTLSWCLPGSRDEGGGSEEGVPVREGDGRAERVVLGAEFEDLAQ